VSIRCRNPAFDGGVFGGQCFEGEGVGGVGCWIPAWECGSAYFDGDGGDVGDGSNLEYAVGEDDD